MNAILTTTPALAGIRPTSDGKVSGMIRQTSSPASAAATERRSVVIVGLFMTVVPMLLLPIMPLVPLGLLEDWLLAHGFASWIESSMLAELAVRPLEDLASSGPGLFAAWVARRPQVVETAPPRSAVGHNTVVAACATLVLAGLLHILFDLPTGYIAGPRTLAAVSLPAKLTAISVNSLWSPFVEEYYYRHALWGLIRPHISARATVILTATAFAAGHPIELVAWAWVFGLFVGAVRERTGHIGPTLAIHCIWNFVAYTDAWGLI